MALPNYKLSMDVGASRDAATIRTTRKTEVKFPCETPMLNRHQWGRGFLAFPDPTWTQPDSLATPQMENYWSSAIWVWSFVVARFACNLFVRTGLAPLVNFFFQFAEKKLFFWEMAINGDDQFFLGSLWASQEELGWIWIWMFLQFRFLSPHPGK